MGSVVQAKHKLKVPKVHWREKQSSFTTSLRPPHTADDITDHSSKHMSVLTLCRHLFVFIFSESQTVGIKVDLVSSGSDISLKRSANAT